MSFSSDSERIEARRAAINKARNEWLFALRQIFTQSLTKRNGQLSSKEKANLEFLGWQIRSGMRNDPDAVSSLGQDRETAIRTNQDPS